MFQVNRHSKRVERTSASNGLLSIVWKDVVRKDKLRRDLSNHPKHRVILFIFVCILLPQHLLKLNLIKALDILSCVDLG
jgi:hypothetical protein